MRAAALLAATRPTNPPTIAASPILSVSTPSWFGSSAINLLPDPIFMTSTWVFPPAEVIGFRPSLSPTIPAWRDDTTRNLTYQTLSVAAPGVAARAPNAVDALAFWNRKPDGLVGDCALFGFNSAAAPDLSFGPPRAASWHANLSSDCDNINEATPWSRFALSDDGATAVAWVQGARGNLTIFALDGATGTTRWARPVSCGAPADCAYFLSYGADVSADGRFIVYDEGVVGTGAHRVHVLDAATGAPRGAPVESADAVPAHISPDGAFLLSSDSADVTGAFSTWRWDAAAGAYARVGGGAPPLAAPGGWVLAQHAFSQDVVGTTWLGVVWYDASLAGASVLALFNASAPTAAVTFAVMHALPGSDKANAGAVVDCAGGLCAAGFYTQEAGNDAQPTLVVVAAGAPGVVWNATLPGSVDAVSVARSAASEYFVLATGCSSESVCTKPGGFARAFRVAVG